MDEMPGHVSGSVSLTPGYKSKAYKDKCTPVITEALGMEVIRNCSLEQHKMTRNRKPSGLQKGIRMGTVQIPSKIFINLRL